MKRQDVSKEIPLVSLIIRTKNEEKWISSCLRSVFHQTYKNIEVILVDNESTDQTVTRAKEFPVKVVNISKFLPGKSINIGIRASSGEYLVCLSGHCIPSNNTWLEKLIYDLYDPRVAGVYGRQEPLAFTSDFDKRDLLIAFGLDKKVQIKDSFFHNANSAFRRDVWERFPFDEEVTNIEDRVWGQKVIASGMKIIYEPEASVFHWHGIHHDLNPERARKIVRIMEGLDGLITNQSNDAIESMDIVAIIPVRGSSIKVGKKNLLEYTLRIALGSKLIKRVVVSTDNEETAKLAKNIGAFAPFIRPSNLSEDYVDVGDVLSYSLDQIEKKYGVPDLVVLMEETYPFRTANLIDEMIVQLVHDGLDSLVAVKTESRGIWLDTEGVLEELLEGFMPSSLKKSQALVGLMGLGYVTRPMFIRSSNLYGNRLGVYKINDPFAPIQVRDPIGVMIAEKFLERWWNSTVEPESK